MTWNPQVIKSLLDSHAASNAAAGPRDPATVSGLAGIFANVPLMSALLAFLAAQITKLFTNYHEEGRWDWTRLIGSGGMPSSHSSFVMGLTTAIGVTQGTSSPSFAVAIVFSLIVMYDATGVRAASGKHASILNMIMQEMPADHPVQDAGRLSHTLGHTPLQVLIGALVGIVIGFLVAAIAG